MKIGCIVSALVAQIIASASGFTATGVTNKPYHSFQHEASQTTRSTSLRMIDDTIIMGGGIAVFGLAVGVGLVAFTENQGERAKARGSGLSEGMSTRITGGLMEDVEVSSVDDLGSLTSQLEKALKETSGTEVEEMTEEEKKKIEEAADDGW